MSFLASSGIQGTVLSQIDSAAGNLAVASRLAATNANVAKAVQNSATQQAQASQMSRTYTLLLNPPQSQIAQPATPQQTSLSSASGQSLTVIGRVKTTLPPAPPASRITLDVTLKGSDAFAQAYERVARARSSTHATADGFYVDEFGFQPAVIDVEATLIFGTNPASQIEAIDDFFAQTKRITPFVNQRPPRVYFLDSFAGKTFLVNLQELRLRQSVDSPLLGLFTFRGEILMDRSSVVTQSTSNVVQQPPTLSGVPTNLVSFSSSSISTTTA